jgi:hypothetical protein
MGTATDTYAGLKFTPQEVFDLETLLQHASLKVVALLDAGGTPEVTRDHLGTLHVNAAVLRRTLTRLLVSLETEHGFRRASV